MTLLLIVPAWILLLSVIVGLCCAARLGDAGGAAELREPEAEWRASAGGPAVQGGAGRGRGHVSPARPSGASRPPARAEIAA
jgi:hypothetical protein